MSCEAIGGMTRKQRGGEAKLGEGERAKERDSWRDRDNGREMGGEGDREDRNERYVYSNGRMGRERGRGGLRGKPLSF